MRLDSRGLLALLAAAATFSATAQPFTVGDPMDPFVSRGRPDDAERFAKGDLGIVLTSYARAPLYEAFRALSLGRAAVADEDHKWQRNTRDQEGALAAWLEARKAIKGEAPRREIDLYRLQAQDSLGSFINCTPGAFELATQTLAGLKRDVGAREVRQWLDAQDSVFEFCTHVPGTPGTPTVPAPLDAGAPVRLRQLRQYQEAAAQFYGGQYTQAQAAFAQIADVKDHPLRGWAALASLRATLRDASLDMAWERRFGELNRGSLPAAEKQAAISAAAKVHNERRRAAMTAIETRALAMLDNPDLAAMHPAIRAFLRQAVSMLDPWRAYGLYGAELEKLDRNPYTHGVLSNWEDLGDRLLDFGPPGPDVTPLRQRAVYFDWIRTVQGCVDNPASPNFTGRCDEEHAHALDEWKRTGAHVWLVATLVTAPKVTAANIGAVEAALRVDDNAVGWLTLRYHAARVMRESGRLDSARALVDGALASAPKDRSSVNLLKQLRVALSPDLAAATPHLVRSYKAARSVNVVDIGADGDELLNRRLTAKDMLALAQAPATPVPLQRQLAVAAWFRADLLDQFDTADQAARVALGVVPTLRGILEAYLGKTAPGDKHDVVLVAAVRAGVSPLAFRAPLAQFALARRQGTAGDAWCSFDARGLEKVQRVQRLIPVTLGSDPARRDAELAQLAKLGSGPQWFARQSFDYARRHPDEPNLASLMKLVAQSTATEACPHPEAAAVKRDAERLVAK